jgi:hypothetical protein
MKKMNNAVTFYVIFVIRTLTAAGDCNVGYSTISEMENKIGTENLLNTLHAESLLVCAAECLRNCSCFGYHQEIKQCRLHAICNINQIVTEGLGWRYYRVLLNGK